MAPSQSPYTRNTQELYASENALYGASTELRKALNENLLPRLLGRSAAIAGAAFILRAAATASSSSIPSAVKFARAGFGFVGLGAGLVAIALLIGNFGKLRQRWLAKRLGLRDVTYSKWKVSQKTHLRTKIGYGVVMAVGGALLIFAMVKGMPANGPAREAIRLGGLIGAAFLFFGGAVLNWHSVQRRLALLGVMKDAARLGATLSAIQRVPNAGADIPAAVLEEVAGVEDMQIARNRTKAVLAGVSATQREYELLISRQVAARRASLPADRRREVEELIETLAAEPYPATSSGPKGRPDSRWANRSDDVFVRETATRSAAVHYRVDEERRRIEIVGLSAPGILSGEPTRDSHAR